MLTGDTTVQLQDDLAKPPSTYLPSGPELPFGNPLVQLHNCETIQLLEFSPDHENNEEGDPLSEGIYFRAHRRVERQEKQLRNIERERAQHEKLQVDRLLDELRGQDWLRVMGIAGPDNARKLYEPKRDYFVRELTALIDKFKVWKEEEKRRKLAKDNKPFTTSPDFDDNKHELEEEANTGVDAQSTGDPVDDVDAQAARQLLREARSATTSKRSKPKQTHSEKRRKSKPAGQEPQSQPPSAQQYQQPSPPQPQPLPEPPLVFENKPFTSFFSDLELRAMALGKANRAPPHTLAFGYPIPEMKEQDFELPPDILNNNAILASQRKQRRMRREGRKSGQ